MVKRAIASEEALTPEAQKALLDLCGPDALVKLWRRDDCTTKTADAIAARDDVLADVAPPAQDPARESDIARQLAGLPLRKLTDAASFVRRVATVSVHECTDRRLATISTMACSVRDPQLCSQILAMFTVEQWMRPASAAGLFRTQGLLGKVDDPGDFVLRAAPVAKHKALSELVSSRWFTFEVAHHVPLSVVASSSFAARIFSELSTAAGGDGNLVGGLCNDSRTASEILEAVTAVLEGGSRSAAGNSTPPTRGRT